MHHVLLLLVACPSWNLLHNNIRKHRMHLCVRFVLTKHNNFIRSIPAWRSSNYATTPIYPLASCMVVYSEGSHMININSALLPVAWCYIAVVLYLWYFSGPSLCKALSKTLPFIVAYQGNVSSLDKKLPNLPCWFSLQIWYEKIRFNKSHWDQFIPHLGMPGWFKPYQFGSV